jgi:penicillin-binding protein 2
MTVGVIFLLFVTGFSTRAFNLQIARGANLADVSRNNTLDRSVLFASRGVLYDRTGTELAWNVASVVGTSSPLTLGASTTKKIVPPSYALRKYTDLSGFSHLLGFVRYPKTDAGGAWWQEVYTGVSGVEQEQDARLSGTNGSALTETNAHGHVQQSNMVSPAIDGTNVTLSIDASVQHELYKALVEHAKSQGFKGGAGIIMDVHTGELLALTSFPEYDTQAFTDGDAKVIAETSNDPTKPFLNRAIAGLYAPGSIVKPIFAAAALHEHLISPEKEILSTGAITIPNPYDEKKPSVFHDWTVHGLIDMRTAIAVSSDEYFYTIGGGYRDQKGLGIVRIEDYARRFGLGTTTGIAFTGERRGVIPSPEWKAQVFPADRDWRLGDTYHTAIGQYGFQITPIQAAVFATAIANGGSLLTPQIIASSTSQARSIDISDADLQVVREGMRLAVTTTRKDGTVGVLNIPGIELAAKTGTAQIGSRNQWVNSWTIGFWPASHPRYAFAVVLEAAPSSETAGIAHGLKTFFEWLVTNKAEYLN